jgi:hypothetical protein
VISTFLVVGVGVIYGALIRKPSKQRTSKIAWFGLAALVVLSGGFAHAVITQNEFGLWFFFLSLGTALFVMLEFIVGALLGTFAKKLLQQPREK